MKEDRNIFTIGALRTELRRTTPKEWEMIPGSFHGAMHGLLQKHDTAKLAGWVADIPQYVWGIGEEESDDESDDEMIF